MTIKRECKHCHGKIWKEGPRYGGPALYWRDSTGFSCIVSIAKGGTGGHAPVRDRSTRVTDLTTSLVSTILDHETR